MPRWTIPLILLVLAACSPGAGSDSTLATTMTIPSATVSATTTAPSTTTTTTTAATTTMPAPPPPLDEVDLSLELVADGFTQPVLVTHRGDSTLFVVDQVGTIWALDGDDRRVALDVTALVDFRGERGLLGLAFDPADPSRMFVDYIERGSGDTVVAEYHLAPGRDPAVSGPAQEVLRVEQPAGNHNGGMIAFGPDGLLYVALGDGGGANDRFRHGQNPFTLLGALLRIDVSALPGYTIPPDNPFADGAQGAPEVWAWGLRNPWRFSFDGDDLWIGDVGQGRIEEVNLITIAATGTNFGWPILEGTECFGGTATQCADAAYTPPIHEYRHTGGRCSITGGYVYRGSAFPALAGAYVFGDYCSGEIMALRVADGVVTEHTTFTARLPQLTSFGIDAAGEMYATAGDGVYRIVPG